MPSFNLLEAVRDALNLALQHDQQVMLLGEDIGKYGGVFRATEGLQARYGEQRVVDTPLAESGIIGTAVGLAIGGLKPVCEIQFAAFLYPGMEQLLSHVARMRLRTQGNYPLSMVIRMPTGGGVKGPELHSEAVESYLVHTAGLKVVMPATPKEAKGLLLSAIADPDPVLFLEPLALYRRERTEVPPSLYQIPLGVARRVSTGSDVTLITWGNMVPVVEKVAYSLQKEHISCEVIDLRTLYPFDEQALLQSVQKTGRVVIVHEAQRTLGLGAELAAFLQEEAFLSLQAPIVRVTGYDVPMPLAALEAAFRPDEQRVLQAIHRVLRY